MFGTDFAERLKSIKTIEAVSNELKLPSSSTKGSRSPFKLTEAGSSFRRDGSGEKTDVQALPFEQSEGPPLKTSGKTKEGVKVSLQAYAGRLGKFLKQWNNLT